MKKLLPLALLALAGVAASANDSVTTPLTTINFRGEELPVYGMPHPIHAKKRVAPRFPAAEWSGGINGFAVVTLLVGTDGKVLESSVLTSEPTPAFGAAARAATLKWRFEPQLRDGKPTKFIVQQTINFTISSRVTAASGPTMDLVPPRLPYYEGFGRTP